MNCEEAIIKDKERFGRVRKSLMMYIYERSMEGKWQTGRFGESIEEELKVI